MTLWKSQVMTIKGLVKSLLGKKEKIAWVYLCRYVKSFNCDQINLGPRCLFERITSKFSSWLRIKVTLVEDKRLNVLYETCKEFFFQNDIICVSIIV